MMDKLYEFVNNLEHAIAHNELDSFFETYTGRDGCLIKTTRKCGGFWGYKLDCGDFDVEYDAREKHVACRSSRRVSPAITVAPCLGDKLAEYICANCFETPNGVEYIDEMPAAPIHVVYGAGLNGDDYELEAEIYTTLPEWAVYYILDDATDYWYDDDGSGAAWTYPLPEYWKIKLMERGIKIKSWNATIMEE